MLLLAATPENSLLTAYSAALVAFVAGGFSLLGLTVAKENKVSEFRQDWIDKLRKDISEFSSQAQRIHSAICEAFRVKGAMFWQSEASDLNSSLDINRTAMRIKLRLNPGEEEHQELKKLIEDMQEMLRNGPSNELPLPEYYSQFEPLAKAIEMNTTFMLKTEWERVKKGERGYRWTRNAAIAALVLSVAAAIALYRTVPH